MGFTTVVDLLSTYAGRGPDLGDWLRGAEINRDRNLRLQYLAGLGFNTRQSRSIYEHLMACRRTPTGLFVRHRMPR